MNPVILQSLITSLQDLLENKQVNVNSAMCIIAKGMELMDNFKDVSGSEKKKYLIKTIEIVAKGKDGVFGTADDLIPESTAKTLTLFLEQNLIEDTVQLLMDASKGKLNLNQVQHVGVGCLSFWSQVCSSMSKPKTASKVNLEMAAPL